MNALILFTSLLIGVLIGEFRMGFYVRKKVVNYIKSTGKTERVASEIATLILNGHYK